MSTPASILATQSAPASSQSPSIQYIPTQTPPSAPSIGSLSVSSSRPDSASSASSSIGTTSGTSSAFSDFAHQLLGQSSPATFSHGISTEAFQLPSIIMPSSTQASLFSSSAGHHPSTHPSSLRPTPLDSLSSTSSLSYPADAPFSSSSSTIQLSSASLRPAELTTTISTTPAEHPTRSPPSHHHMSHPPFKPDRLATLDLIIVVIYICLLLSTSISTMIRVKKSKRKHAALNASKGLAGASSGSAFLAGGRKMNWFTVGASIFASNLGSEHFIGLSGSAAANGLSVAAFEMNALIILQLSTWIFLPVLIVSKISTLPEYMQKRFGGKRIRTYLAVLSILLYIFTKISVNLYSGGIFIQQAVGWNLYTSAMFILALTSVMTLTGGLKGAMMIDNLQAFVMTIGASIVSAKALIAIGGWQGLKQRYPDAVPSKVPANLTHCAQPNARAFQMLRPWNDRDMPWLGFIFGQTPASIWYWCADQMMVQRFLSARTLAHVQGSGVFAGYLKILSLLFMVIPGMISRCLYTDEVSCIDPDECLKHCQSSVSCSNTAYPRLVLELMPLGARGMLVAAMVAALMNDLCNVFNSASALFSCDIWPLFRSRSSPKEQETVGRVFVFVLVLASIMWIPVIQEMQGGQLFIYVQAVAALFAPPIAAVYCCAVLSTRTNEAGAFWAMMIGFFLGIFRLVLSFMYKDPSCGQTEDDRPWLLRVHYMYYAAFLFLMGGGCAMLISMLTKPPAPFRLIRTTFWTRFDTQLRKDDKNVYEMRYTGKTTSRDSGGTTSTLLSKRDDSSSQLTENTSGPTGLIPAKTALDNSSPSQLFTIEEQQERKTADLSSIIVDINSEPAPAAKDPTAGADTKSKPTDQTNQQQLTSGGKRAGLSHQASLSGAVGAASEAGKFIASRLASEVNLKGAKAKEMMLAAANHLTNPSSQIKFKNLRGDDDDDEDAEDDEEDDDEPESTNLDGEDDEEEEEEDDGDGDRMSSQQRLQQRQKRPFKRPGASSFSASLPYKFKQKLKGGYQKASAFDDDDDDYEEGYDDDDDEGTGFKMQPKHAKSRQIRSKSHDGDDGGGSSTDDARTTSSSGLNGTRKLLGSASSKTNSFKNKRASARQKRRSSKRHQFKAPPAAVYEEPEESGDLDGKTYKCLDNTIALLIKTRFEETILRIAVGAIVLVALGIFILFSLPPTLPDKQIIEMLNE